MSDIASASLYELRISLEFNFAYLDAFYMEELGEECLPENLQIFYLLKLFSWLYLTCVVSIVELTSLKPVTLQLLSARLYFSFLIVCFCCSYDCLVNSFRSFTLCALLLSWKHDSFFDKCIIVTDFLLQSPNCLFISVCVWVGVCVWVFARRCPSSKYPQEWPFTSVCTHHCR